MMVDLKFDASKRASGSRVSKKVNQKFALVGGAVRANPIRECGSTLYVGLARAVPPTNTNFRLTF